MNNNRCVDNIYLSLAIYNHMPISKLAKDTASKACGGDSVGYCNGLTAHQDRHKVGGTLKTHETINSCANTCTLKKSGQWIY